MTKMIASCRVMLLFMCSLLLTGCSEEDGALKFFPPNPPLEESIALISGYTYIEREPGRGPPTLQYEHFGKDGSYYRFSKEEKKGSKPVSITEGTWGVQPLKAKYFGGTVVVKKTYYRSYIPYGGDTEKFSYRNTEYSFYVSEIPDHDEIKTREFSKVKGFPHRSEYMAELRRLKSENPVEENDGGPASGLIMLPICILTAMLACM